MEWRRCSLHLRFNMDKVPLPFVVCQHSTCATEGNDEARVSYQSEAFRKRQFTMHVFVNSRRDDNRDGYTSFICKGKFNDHQKKAKKLAYDKRVSVCFQKSSWACTEVIIELDLYFVVHATARHGDVRELIDCDILSARAANVVKQTFWDGNFVMCFLSKKETTESAQLIDSTCGCSLRCTPGNVLDMWLVEEDNFLK